ncbi:MAG TPA: glycosyltransferase family 4 protein [Patescibacteria group bacterium]|nr:glycosyltransferase family 4 protein [Patescibacteria group bacterium]
MRIVMIGQKGYPAKSGGVEKHVEELSKRLVKHGHEIFVFCRPWYTGERVEKDVDGVHCLPALSTRTKHLDAISHTFFSILKAAWLKPDLFHFHGVGPALLAWLPRLVCPSAKVIVTFHSIDRRQEKWGRLARIMLRLGERLACRVPDRTITVSKALTDYCHVSYGADTTYIPNGVVAPHPRKKPDPSLLAPFDLKPEKYFLMVARLVRNKGAHTLLEAWKKAKENRPDLFSSLKIAIVGGAAFGAEDCLSELKILSAGDSSVVLTGEQTGETLQALFANAYAAVHPSISEGMPLSVLEAMAHGKCVLASDIPAHRELTDAYGLTFRTGNVEDLAKQLVMVAEAPELAAHVGAEAAEYVRKNYDWEEIVLETKMVYRQLLHLKTISLPSVISSQSQKIA